MESAYADPQLLGDLGIRGARFARELDVDVVVGAETAGVPLAASIALAGGLPFAFVRNPGYRGHETTNRRSAGRTSRVGRVLTAKRHGALEAVDTPHDWRDWYAAYMDARRQGNIQEAAATAAGRSMAAIKHVPAAA